MGGGVWPALLTGCSARLERLPDPNGTADDEAFWREVRALYEPPDDRTGLDQANIGPTPLPVFDAYVERARFLSRAPARRQNELWEGDLDKQARPALARFLGTEPSKLAFTDSATVGLNTILHGFPLETGDEVLVTDHEYPDMIETIEQRARRYGIVKRVVPVPRPDEDRMLLAERVEQSIGPRTRLLLISHVSAWSGEILPVKEVTEVARARGVAVLVDAAQSLGVLEVDFEEIGCDFLAASLHKWLGAPVASGVLVMRPEHVGQVMPLHPPSWNVDEYPMDRYEWSGTFNMAARASVYEALEVLTWMGLERRRARLLKLGRLWMEAVRAVPGAKLWTPLDPDRFFGVGSFALEGETSAALAERLWKEHRIVVQDKSGRHSPFANAVRVAPNVFTTPTELEQFVSALG